MIHCRQPSALIIECGRQSLTCLANQVEALLDGAEAGHLGVPRINGRPIVGGIENDVSAQSSALRNQLREVAVEADDGTQPSVGCIQSSQFPVPAHLHRRLRTWHRARLAVLPRNLAVWLD